MERGRLGHDVTPHEMPGNPPGTMDEMDGFYSLVFLKGDGGVNTSAKTPDTLRDLAYGVVLLSCARLGVGGQPGIRDGLDQSTNSHLDRFSIAYRDAEGSKDTKN